MLFTMNARIWVEAPNGADPEDLATEMSLGLEHQLSGFPSADVVKADVNGIYETPEKEIDEEGLGE